MTDLHKLHQLRPGHCIYQIVKREFMRAILWEDGVVSGIHNDGSVVLNIPYTTPCQ